MYCINLLFISDFIPLSCFPSFMFSFFHSFFSFCLFSFFLVYFSPIIFIFPYVFSLSFPLFFYLNHFLLYLPLFSLSPSFYLSFPLFTIFPFFLSSSFSLSSPFLYLPLFSLSFHSLFSVSPIHTLFDSPFVSLIQIFSSFHFFYFAIFSTDHLIFYFLHYSFSRLVIFSSFLSQIIFT